MKRLGLAVLITMFSVPMTADLAAQDAARTRLLPPERPWSGESENLVVAHDHPWITPSEQTDLTETPRYDETVAWLKRLVNASPQLHLTSIGRSAEGRDIWMVIASRNGEDSVEQLRQSGRPLLLAHSGIHSGEIDGKDAGLMLLRDMTVVGTKSELLDQANLLFIPILSVDAHERFSEFSRINQRGPREMGWRTNSRNLNLNRDFTKLQTEEVRALLQVINTYGPDLYLDLHVTDGADYQYDVTYGYNGPHAWSPRIASWLDSRFRPSIDSALTAMGHIPGPLLFAADGRQMTSGNYWWTAGPRFSNGYGDARHLPTVLVENHSLKPYRQRVLGTYVLLESTLRLLASDFRSLRAAATADRALRKDTLTLAWTVPDEESTGSSWTVASTTVSRTMHLKGIRSELRESPITGTDHVAWTGEPVNSEIPVFPMVAASTIAGRPDRYFIPAGWSEITRLLEWHGVHVDHISQPTTVQAIMTRIPDAMIEPQAFEGRARVTPGQVVTEQRDMTLMPGAAVVSTDQELGDLVMLLLEPESPDSFLQWGFFLEIMQRTEYVEGYIMEPMARKMLEEDAGLRARFDDMLATDSTFSASPRARLQWFYEQTPFYDDQYKLYPVGRSID
ncbi:MAG: M14 family metallopeptidase [Rhodothermales bacterium]|nr:M14 family metallopeptidase [Rhodothermales bacterium]